MTYEEVLQELSKLSKEDLAQPAMIHLTQENIDKLIIFIKTDPPKIIVD